MTLPTHADELQHPLAGHRLVREQLLGQRVQGSAVSAQDMLALEVQRLEQLVGLAHGRRDLPGGMLRRQRANAEERAVLAETVAPHHVECQP
jgi:hypothetical protein